MVFFNFEVCHPHPPTGGFDVEISSSNTPPRELYRIILSDSNEENLMMVIFDRNVYFFF